MSGLIHTGLGSSSIIAHVVHSPPPPPANSFVICPAVINTHTCSSGPRGLDRYHALKDTSHKGNTPNRDSTTKSKDDRDVTVSRFQISGDRCTQFLRSTGMLERSSSHVPQANPRKELLQRCVHHEPRTSHGDTHALVSPLYYTTHHSCITRYILHTQYAPHLAQVLA